MVGEQVEIGVEGEVVSPREVRFNTGEVLGFAPEAEAKIKALFADESLDRRETFAFGIIRGREPEFEVIDVVLPDEELQLEKQMADFFEGGILRDLVNVSRSFVIDVSWRGEKLSIMIYPNEFVAAKRRSLEKVEVKKAEDIVLSRRFIIDEAGEINRESIALSGFPAAVGEIMGLERGVLPKSITELRQQLEEGSDKISLGEEEGGNFKVIVANKWDLVSYSGWVMPTEAYWARVEAVARGLVQETGDETIRVGYGVHNHPIMSGVEDWQTTEGHVVVDVVDLSKVVEDLKRFSIGDLRGVIENWGIPFFEIRATEVGGLERFVSRGEGRVYSVAEILADSLGLKQAITKLNKFSGRGLGARRRTVELADELRNRISETDSQGYRVEDMVTYYVGEEKMEKLRLKLDFGRIFDGSGQCVVKNNKDFLWFHLLKTVVTWQELPRISQEVLELRQELHLVELMEMVGSGLKLRWKKLGWGGGPGATVWSELSSRVGGNTGDFEGETNLEEVVVSTNPERIRQVFRQVVEFMFQEPGLEKKMRRFLINKGLAGHDLVKDLLG